MTTCRLLHITPNHWEYAGAHHQWPPGHVDQRARDVWQRGRCVVSGGEGAHGEPPSATAVSHIMHLALLLVVTTALEASKHWRDSLVKLVTWGLRGSWVVVPGMVWNSRQSAGGAPPASSRKHTAAPELPGKYLCPAGTYTGCWSAGALGGQHGKHALLLAPVGLGHVVATGCLPVLVKAYGAAPHPKAFVPLLQSYAGSDSFHNCC